MSSTPCILLLSQLELRLFESNSCLDNSVACSVVAPRELSVRGIGVVVRCAESCSLAPARNRDDVALEKGSNGFFCASTANSDLLGDDGKKNAPWPSIIECLGEAEGGVCGIGGREYRRECERECDDEGLDGLMVTPIPSTFSAPPRGPRRRDAAEERRDRGRECGRD